MEAFIITRQTKLKNGRLKIDGKVFDLLTNRPVLLCDACFPGGEDLTIGLGDPRPCWICGTAIDPDVDKYHFRRAQDITPQIYRRVPSASRSRRVMVPRFDSDNRSDWVGNTW